jgi:uncharacterized protein
MKFQPDTAEGVNAVTRQEPGRVWVGSLPFESSILVPWKGEVLPWEPSSHAELLPEHFARILALKPEVVIFGSGLRLQFPQPSLLKALINARIGVETMDTAAACRTYNVLISERRSAVAALLLQRALPG